MSNKFANIARACVPNTMHNTVYENYQSTLPEIREIIHLIKTMKYNFFEFIDDYVTDKYPRDVNKVFSQEENT
jgi:hypothetical protein